MRTRANQQSNGSVLVGLLWCVTLLSLLVIGVLHTATMDMMIVKNYGDRIQAHYMAVAGIEKAKALLYQSARDRSRGSQNHSGELYNSPQQFRDVALGRGHFRVFRRGRQDEGGGVIYGINDEESRLNVNMADSNQLSKLNGMAPEVIAAIMDWRDSDNEVTPGGAEKEFYATLQPPYQPRNGPLPTVRELLMVRGISSDLLVGKDTHQNGFFEPDGDVGDNTGREGFQASDTDAGWAGLLTVDSRVSNVSADGKDRVNVQTADETALTGVPGITQAIAKAIVSYRGQNQFQSIADLLDVTASQNQGGVTGGSGRSSGGSSQSLGGSSGSKLIDENLLMDIADEVTTATGTETPGLVNINTASLDVLACLPGLDRQLADLIIRQRQSAGFFPNPAWLLKVPGLNQQVFKQVAPLVTARSETFRILSEGRAGSGGVRQRIQVIVHLGLHDLSTLSYREEDL